MAAKGNDMGYMREWDWEYFKEWEKNELWESIECGLIPVRRVEDEPRMP